MKLRLHFKNITKLNSQPKQESRENIKTSLNSLDRPSIGVHQNECLMLQITSKELETVLNELKNRHQGVMVYRMSGIRPLGRV